MPELGSLTTPEFRAVEHAFNAASTMGLVLAVMQLLVLYVGTNRFRLRPTLFGTAGGT
jgi:hypothetical protein